ncbi:MAG: CoA transferase [Proteobacteria bacterium]|nr:MAG: CoA transferase [Pseudomonadota bacterium]
MQVARPGHWRSHWRRYERATALWADSGAMALTGFAGEEPRVAPAPIAVLAKGRAARLCALAAREGVSLTLDGPALLGERAACHGFARRGRVSVGGSARLLRALGSWIAVNLPRPDDVACVPAWLECGPIDGDPWDVVATRVRGRVAEELVERAAWLGLAVAVPQFRKWRPVRLVGAGPRAARPAGRRPLVVDLSSLWAGPLCGHLLGLAGARVVKVEDVARPDGARAGAASFFDLLNAGKESVALAFASGDGRAALSGLLDAADVVIESARPRALQQLGIDADARVRARPGLTWISITGYGRHDPHGLRVAFGDDAAVAAGWAHAAGGRDGPLFCGDAIADPMAGLAAAAAALEAWQDGRSALFDVALCDALGPPVAIPEEVGRGLFAAPPRARTPAGRARPLGADTAAVLRDLGIRA